jgi:hypothetical protein
MGEPPPFVITLDDVDPSWVPGPLPGMLLDCLHEGCESSVNLTPGGKCAREGQILYCGEGHRHIAAR